VAVKLRIEIEKTERLIILMTMPAKSFSRTLHLVCGTCRICEIDFSPSGVSGQFAGRPIRFGFLATA